MNTLAENIVLLGCPNPSCDCADEDAGSFDHRAGSLVRYECACGASGPWRHDFNAAAKAWNELPRASSERVLAKLLRTKKIKIHDIPEDYARLVNERFWELV